MDHTKLIIVKSGCKNYGYELLNSLSIRAYALDYGIWVFDYPRVNRIIFWFYNKFRVEKIWNIRIKANGPITYLPPTEPAALPNTAISLFIGWPFRNPAGLAKHRAQLLKIFGPTKSEQRFVDKQLAGTEGKTLIGIHLREICFKGFEDGEFLVPTERVDMIVEEYLSKNNISKEEAAFIVVSDKQAPGDNRANLHLLSRCSVVIGDNSIYANTAAWFGNIPHIVTTPEPIDWEYYAGKREYFENKYATFAL